MFNYGDVVIYGEMKWRIVDCPDPRIPLYEIRDIYAPWMPTIKVPGSCLKLSETCEKVSYNKIAYKGGYLDPRYTPNKVIFNPPATIVFWEDGTKTVVKCRDGEIFSPDAGYSIALARKLYGNNFRKIFKTVSTAWDTCIDDAVDHLRDILGCEDDIPDHKFEMGDKVSYLHGKKVYSVIGIRRKTDSDEWEYKLQGDACNDHYMFESHLRKV